MVMSDYTRMGDASTSVLVTTRQTRRLTIGEYVSELAAHYRGIAPEKITDDIVLGYDANQIAFTLEQTAELPSGSVEDRLPKKSELTVGDVIRAGIDAYQAARPKPESFWHYPLPG